MQRLSPLAEPRVTADALAVVRADAFSAGQGVLPDPFARFFVTDGGRQLAHVAERLDPLYRLFALTRFDYVARRMAEGAGRFPQMVLLGVGYDTRAIWLPEFRVQRCQVFEVDFAETLTAKRRVLARRGVTWPPWIVQVPANLADGDLPRRLAAAGFRPRDPALVVAEGLLFFLQAEVAMALVQPRRLRLAPGSETLFDYWSQRRIDRLNAAALAALGAPLFGRCPLPGTATDARRRLHAMGLTRARVTPLSRIAARVWQNRPARDPIGAWRVVEAVVGAPTALARSASSRRAYLR